MSYRKLTVGVLCFSFGAVLISSSPAQAALKAYYAFENNVNDSSGNGYTGAVSGNTAYAAGVSGQAFSFDGGANIATTSTDNLDIVNHSFTVDAYVKFTSPATTNYSIFGTTTGATNLGLHLNERGGKPLMGFYANDTNGNTVLGADTFYNIAFVYDAAAQTQTIYVNGVLDNSTGGHAAFQGTGQIAQIGLGCCDGKMVGLIDELRVYDNALTQSEVQALLVPEPVGLGLLGVASTLLIRRRRSR